jgi:hypothetical protein
LYLFFEGTPIKTGTKEKHIIIIEKLMDVEDKNLQEDFQETNYYLLLFL